MTTTLTWPTYVPVPLTFAQLAVGAPVAADFHAGEQDWYKLDLVQGQTYQIALQGGSGGPGNPHLRIIDAQGRQYTNEVSTGPAPGMTTLPYTPLESGSFYVQAIGYGNTGSYTIAASLQPNDDFGETKFTTGVLPIGGTVNGTLGLINDADWFALDLTAGQLYSFSLEGRDGSVLDNVSVNLFNFLGSPVQLGRIYLNHFAQPDFRPASPVVSGAPDFTGRIYAQVASSLITTDYTLRATTVADDFTAVAAGSGAMTVGGPAVAGRIDANYDRDWFGVTLEAGHSYQFSATPQGEGVPLSLGLVIPGSGFLGRLDPAMVYTAAESGVYHLQVAAPLQLQYQVAVAHVADDYFGNQTGSLASGAASGVINFAGDSDYFAAPVEAGSVYRMEFDSAGPETRQSGFGAITFGPRISYLQHATVGVNSYVEYFRADEAGNAMAYMSGANLGAYAIRFQKVGVDDCGNEHVDARPLALGATLEGSMDGFGDVDSFSWRGEAGKTYEITARSALGPAIGLGFWQDGTNATYGGHFTFTPSHGEPMVIYLGAGNSSGRYDISISLKEDSQLAGALNGARVDAGGGHDTIRFDGRLSDYTVTRSGFDIKLAGASGASATLANVERVLFASGDGLALDIDGVGGAAYRLYRAAFDRTPDKAGVSFWIKALDQGISLHDVAQEFINSNEFKALYGVGSTNAEFVTRLYSNILDRAPDAGGFDYWLTALNNGYARADVLANFSESAENADAVAALIGTGFAYVPYGG
ncbi:MAG: DUF4214 domain-containing protein [Pseudomonadota bacterium]